MGLNAMPCHAIKNVQMKIKEKISFIPFCTITTISVDGESKLHPTINNNDNNNNNMHRHQTTTNTPPKTIEKIRDEMKKIHNKNSKRAETKVG